MPDLLCYVIMREILLI